MSFTILFNGLKLFNNDTSNIGVLLAVGMLTFLSVFFNFVNPYTKLLDTFDKYADLNITQMEARAFEKLRSRDYSGLRFILTDIEQGRNLKKWVKVDLWLYLSIFIYLLSIPFGLISNQNLADIFTTRDIQGVLFYLGFMTAYFLIASVMVTHFIKLYYLRKEDKIHKKPKRKPKP